MNNYAVELLCEQAHAWATSKISRGQAVMPYVCAIDEDDDLYVMGLRGLNSAALRLAWQNFQRGPWLACALVLYGKFRRIEKPPPHDVMFENLADDDDAQLGVSVHATSGVRSYLCIHEVTPEGMELGEIAETRSSLNIDTVLQ
jgi:hypothetical protein